MKPWESRSLALWLTVVPMSVPVALAHDPVFGLGPHTLYKGGVEIHFGSHQEKAGDERATESEIQFKYGLTCPMCAAQGIGVATAGAAPPACPPNTAFGATICRALRNPPPWWPG